MIEEIKQILNTVLQLDGRGSDWDRDTMLLGSVPEIDSMAVVTILTTVEERYDVIVEDDEVSGETFATLGTLVDFVTEKVENA